MKSWHSSQLTVSTGSLAPLKRLSFLSITLSHSDCITSYFPIQKPFVSNWRIASSLSRLFSVRGDPSADFPAGIQQNRIFSPVFISKSRSSPAFGVPKTDGFATGSSFFIDPMRAPFDDGFEGLEISHAPSYFRRTSGNWSRNPPVTSNTSFFVRARTSANTESSVNSSPPEYSPFHAAVRWLRSNSLCPCRSTSSVLLRRSTRRRSPRAVSLAYSGRFA